MEGLTQRGPELGPAGLPAQQDCSIQEKIDLEIRMRQGIWKLLSLSTQKDQILHAVKNLMVCNARIMAYTSELQKLEEQIANQSGRCFLRLDELAFLALLSGINSNARTTTAKSRRWALAMANCRQEGKDPIIFVTKEDHETPGNAELVAKDPTKHRLILPSGDINRNCSCLGGMASGLRETIQVPFSCFNYSTEDV